MVGMFVSAVEVEKAIPFLVWYGMITGQDFAECPLNMLHTLSDDSDRLLVLDCVSGKRDGSQRIPDVMIHLLNHLETRHENAPSLKHAAEQLSREAPDDERRNALGNRSFEVAPEVWDEKIVHQFGNQKCNGRETEANPDEQLIRRALGHEIRFPDSAHVQRQTDHESPFHQQEVNQGPTFSISRRKPQIFDRRLIRPLSEHHGVPPPASEGRPR